MPPQKSYIGKHYKNSVKLSKRTGIALLLVSIAASFIVRYPIFKVHSGGFDSEFIYFLAQSIAVHGQAPWIANPSSYFGLHRFSYPQGAPFMFSIFSQLSGGADEQLIFAYDLIETFMGVLSAFAFSLVLRKKDYLFAFFVSIVFGTAPVYVYTSSWTLSARGLFISFFAFLILAFFLKIPKKIKYPLIAGLFITIFSIHRMAFFLLITLIPTYFIYILYKRKIRYRVGKQVNLKTNILYLAISLFIILPVLLLIYFFYSSPKIAGNLLSSYQSGALIAEKNIFAIAVNIGVTLTVSGGLLAVFSLFLLLFFLKDSRIPEIIKILFIFFLLSFSALFYKNYFRIYNSFILSTFVGFTLIKIMYSYKKYRIRKENIVVSAIFLSLVFSILMQGYWNGAFTERGGDFMDYDKESTVIAIKDLHYNNIFNTLYLGRYTLMHTDKMIMPFVKQEDPYYESTAIGKLSPKDLNLTFEPRMSSGKFYLYFPETKTRELYDVFSNSSIYDYYIFKDVDNGTFVNDVRANCYSIYANKMDSWNINIYYNDRTNPDIANRTLYIH